jgi:hypothetical protein
VRVTTTLRTLVDEIADNTLSHDLQGQAVREAIKRGLVLPEQLASAQTSVRARRRIRRILKQVSDAILSGCRDVAARRVFASTGGFKTDMQMLDRKEADGWSTPVIPSTPGPSGDRASSRTV